MYCRVYSDPDLMRHVGKPLTVVEAAASFAVACRQNAAGGASGWWVAVPRASVDGIGLLGTVRHDRRVEVGVMLLPRWQGNGYALEAVAALIDRVFEQDADVVRMSHSESNAAMAGLMRRLRFERKAVDDNLRWGIGRDRWLAVRAGRPEDFAKNGGDR